MWQLILGSTEASKMLEVPESWAIFQGIAAYMKWNHPERKRQERERLINQSILHAAKPKGEGHLSTLTSDTELQDLEVCPAVCWPCFSTVLTHCTQIAQFWNGNIYSVLLYVGSM